MKVTALKACHRCDL